MSDSLRYVPRHGPSALSELLLSYLIFVRRAEEVFAGALWGSEARNVLRTRLFYGHHGKQYTDADQLSKILSKHFQQHLGIEKFGVQLYRHLAAALGRDRLGLAIEEDVDEDMSTGMDAAAGRTTLTSRRIYALENDKIGTLNEQALAVHRATDRLWHKKILQMDVDVSEDNPSSPAPDITGIEAIVQTALQQANASMISVVAELKRQQLVVSIEETRV